MFIYSDLLEKNDFWNSGQSTVQNSTVCKPKGHNNVFFIYVGENYLMVD